MACTGRKFCDFVSFDPRMPETMQLFVKRIDRDTALIHDLEMQVFNFLLEIDTTVSELREKYG
jgi:hypothetical protein